jgi:excisionase family DNA binding protein
VAASEEQFLSLEDVASRLQVSDQTVRRWIKSGKLTAYKPGLEYRIREADLEEFLRAREVRPKVQRRSPLEPSFNDVLAEEERHAKLAEVKSFIHEYAFARANYWEQELERGRTKEYRTAASAHNLAILAVDEFSSFNRWLFDHGPARPLLVAMEHGGGLEIADEYGALIDALVERITRTQRMLFANAERLAETEAQRDEIAARRLEAETALNANAGRHSA